MQLFGCAPEIHNSVFIKKSEKVKIQMPKKSKCAEFHLIKKVKVQFHNSI